MIKQLKECTKCHRSLRLTDFNDSANGKDFKKAGCKDCEAVYNKFYYSLRKERMKINKEQSQLANNI